MYTTTSNSNQFTFPVQTHPPQLPLSPPIALSPPALVQPGDLSLGFHPIQQLPYNPIPSIPSLYFYQTLPMPPVLPSLVQVTYLEPYVPFNASLYPNPETSPQPTPEPSSIQTPSPKEAELTKVEPSVDHNSPLGSLGPQSEPTVEEKPKRQPKRKKTRLQDTPNFRVKQDLIENTMASLHEMFLGRVLSDDKVLRGPAVIRLHVKTEVAIRSIIQCMQTVLNVPKVEILQISTPVSMKNRYQKKGFLCYFEITDVNMTETVLNTIKANFKCFERCKVARQSSRSTLSPPVCNAPRLTAQLSDGA